MTEPTWWQHLLMIGLVIAIYLVIGVGKGWLIRAIQTTIFILVAGSNIPLKWTESPYLPGLIGLGAAYVLTIWPLQIYDGIQRWRHGHQPPPLQAEQPPAERWAHLLPEMRETDPERIVEMGLNAARPRSLPPSSKEEH